MVKAFKPQSKLNKTPHTHTGEEDEEGVSGKIVLRKIRNGLKNQAVQCKKKKTPKHPNHLFPLHTLMLFIANIGSGKTNAASLVTQEYLKKGSFNRIFCISPTFEHNDALKILPIEEKDVYTDRKAAHSAIDDITQKVKKMGDDYQLVLKYKKAWKKHKRGEKLTLEDQRLLHENDFKKPPKHIPYPSPLLIIDDMSHSTLYRTSSQNDFVNLVLRHRHLYGIGMSIFMLVQNFRSGVPKVIRQNARQFVIWGTHDSTQLEAIYEEVASAVSAEDFYAIYQKAIDNNKHNFLVIDMMAKDPNEIFRRNFDEFISIADCDTHAALRPEDTSHKNQQKRQGPIKIDHLSEDGIIDPAKHDGKNSYTFEKDVNKRKKFI